jgi:hypothetical protein
MAIGSEHADLALQRITAINFVVDKFRILNEAKLGKIPNRYYREGQRLGWRNPSLLHVDFTPGEWRELSECDTQVIPAGVQEFLDGVPAFYADHSDHDVDDNPDCWIEDVFLIITGRGKYWAVAESEDDLDCMIHCTKYFLLDVGSRQDSEDSESEREEEEDVRKEARRMEVDLASPALADEMKKNKFP